MAPFNSVQFIQKVGEYRKPQHLKEWIYRVSLDGPVVKNLPVNAGDSRDANSIPGSGRSPGGRNGNPLQYSCLGNPKDSEAWQATVHGVAKTQILLSH